MFHEIMSSKISTHLQEVVLEVIAQQSSNFKILQICKFVSDQIPRLAITRYSKPLSGRLGLFGLQGKFQLFSPQGSIWFPYTLQIVQGYLNSQALAIGLNFGLSVSPKALYYSDLLFTPPAAQALKLQTSVMSLLGETSLEMLGENFTICTIFANKYSIETQPQTD